MLASSLHLRSCTSSRDRCTCISCFSFCLDRSKKRFRSIQLLFHSFIHSLHESKNDCGPPDPSLDISFISFPKCCCRWITQASAESAHEQFRLPHLPSRFLWPNRLSMVLFFTSNGEYSQLATRCHSTDAITHIRNHQPSRRQRSYTCESCSCKPRSRAETEYLLGEETRWKVGTMTLRPFFCSD